MLAAGKTDDAVQYLLNTNGPTTGALFDTLHADYALNTDGAKQLAAAATQSYETGRLYVTGFLIAARSHRPCRWVCSSSPRSPARSRR